MRGRLCLVRSRDSVAKNQLHIEYAHWPIAKQVGRRPREESVLAFSVGESEDNNK